MPVLSILTLTHDRRRARATGSALVALGVALAVTAVPSAPTQAEEGSDVLERPPHVTPRTEQAIERGVAFLAKQQRRDGSFSEGGAMGSYPTAMTSLAGMAFLGHGDAPRRGRYAW